MQQCAGVFDDSPQQCVQIMFDRNRVAGFIKHLKFAEPPADLLLRPLAVADIQHESLAEKDVSVVIHDIPDFIKEPADIAAARPQAVLRFIRQSILGDLPYFFPDPWLILGMDLPEP